MIAQLLPEVERLTSTAKACALLGKPRASLYRQRNRPAGPRRKPGPSGPPPNALDAAERTQILTVLCQPRFADKAVAQVWAELLDEGVYLCSQSTMYRILRTHNMTRERRRVATHPPRVKPELVAHQPNDVWSWDITKLAGPVRGEFYQLYVMLDIFSRYPVGWRVEYHEDADIAQDWMAELTALHGRPGAIHADRGSAMTSKNVAQLLIDLGVARSHSRPRVSNDNPFSESQFKTLKYRNDFPERFDSIEHARTWCKDFFDYLRHEHRHSALGLHTPASVYFGTAADIQAKRARVMADAYAANPNRFSSPPQPPKLPTAAWINPPTPQPKIVST
ncbi:IS3 family transposase [Mycobacterium lacus]|uniref:Transposase n=3 Tax=Mycobacterium lacus TaxID=169765 RepID=A0A7I7NKN0_9MYCO|nr:IS3 family transposase [Mycobacterium lacus]BBX96251.1 transposase [Mycobacterium lacus]BBX98095.1 transposase [Mycobacterium lacus]BBX99199.1 transposase [Mycobacterium lacus]